LAVLPISLLACHWHKTCPLMNVMRIYQRYFA